MASAEMTSSLRNAVRRERMLDVAFDLIGVHTPTGDARAAADRLQAILVREGFRVDRPDAGHAKSPALVAWLDSGKPGPTMQFNGHLDTVHLPFVPPRMEGDLLRGSGASDMKGGTAAAVEAFLALRDAGLPKSGKVLLTAHDLHEAPWGLGEQLDQLIRDGVHGDAVLIPEPLCDVLPIAGRASAVWKTVFRRQGPAVHEVMRPVDEPSVLSAACQLGVRLDALEKTLSGKQDPVAGSESVFIGQIHGGEIYNQYPRDCFVEGTRRWLPGTTREEVEGQFRAIVDDVRRETGVQADVDFKFVRDPYRLDVSSRLVQVFQEGYELLCGRKLPTGPKRFVDDGNSFYGLAGVPAITHGPKAGGQHTVEEWASLDDMVRVAQLYAVVASLFCDGES
jgi:acetylornithine deacetylase/succinyl-diaminopimelate desuccinylase-like protein